MVLFLSFVFFFWSNLMHFYDQNYNYNKSGKCVSFFFYTGSRLISLPCSDVNLLTGRADRSCNSSFFFFLIFIRI